ncbi:nucleoside 2-deoxyribosyltransferase [Xylophilus sp. Kf1]|nr:nucleoside 2-deoxyribosyltransferase [Xylophilus sp. Kf1]
MTIPAAATASPRVYFAGPDVFFQDAAAIFERLTSASAALGLQGFAPFDGQIDIAAGESPDAFAGRIYEGNVARIRACDGLIANLAPFRGLEPDPGTVFEVGYAVALGKPVVGYHVGREPYAVRVARQRPCTTDADGTVRETGDASLVEGLGQRINLMLSRSILLADDADAALAALARLMRARSPG